MRKNNDPYSHLTQDQKITLTLDLMVKSQSMISNILEGVDIEAVAYMNKFADAILSAHSKSSNDVEGKRK